MPSSDKVFKYCIRLHTKMQSWESLSYYLMRLARVKPRGKSEGTWGCVNSTVRKPRGKSGGTWGCVIVYTVRKPRGKSEGTWGCVYSTETSQQKSAFLVVY